MNAPVVRCNCRYLEHATLDCPYPNGCSGCVCDVHTPESHLCEGCGEFTAHPDQHIRCVSEETTKSVR